MRLRSGKKINWNLNDTYDNLLIDIMFDISIYDNNTVIIKDICDILCCLFNVNLYHFYKIRSTFEIDYKIKKINKKHLNKIMFITNLFLNSDYYNTLSNNKDHIHNVKFMCLFGIIFYYFQMIVIETLYDDMITWKNIKIILQKNHMYIFNYIKYGIDVYNNLTVSDTNIFCNIRRYIIFISNNLDHKI